MNRRHSLATIAAAGACRWQQLPAGFTADADLVTERNGPGKPQYKQRGYQDSGRDDRRDSAPARRPPPENLGGPAAPFHARPPRGDRCAACGTVLAPDTDTAGRCPRCNFELHNCKQCTYFDPGNRFECSRPVTVRP